LRQVGIQNLHRRQQGMTTQTSTRLTIAQDLLNRVEVDPNFINNVITGDETWVFEYDPESKKQHRMAHDAISSSKKGTDKQVKN